jgi:hypothetical protein
MMTVGMIDVFEALGLGPVGRGPGVVGRGLVCVVATVGGVYVGCGSGATDTTDVCVTGSVVVADFVGNATVLVSSFVLCLPDCS